MKITLTIDDNLLIKASQLTGIVEKNVLIIEGLKSLIASESYKQWAYLGNVEKSLKSAKVGKNLNCFGKPSTN
jgi:hypothetical protein